jgi:cell division protein FtsB
MDTTSWILPFLALLIIVSSVVGKTREDNEGAVAIPNWFGFVVIILAFFSCFFTLFKNYTDGQTSKQRIARAEEQRDDLKKDLKDLRKVTDQEIREAKKARNDAETVAKIAKNERAEAMRALSKAQGKIEQLESHSLHLRELSNRLLSENLLLATSAETAPRKIILDIPVKTNASSFAFDPRKILFPGWLNEKDAKYRVIGELDISAESKHFRVKIWFMTVKSKVSIPSDFADKSRKLLYVFFTKANNRTNCEYEKVWKLLSSEMKYDIEKMVTQSENSWYYDPEFETKLSNELTSIVTGRRILFEDCMNGEIRYPLYWPFWLERKNLASLTYQELVLLNRLQIEELFGVQSKVEKFFVMAGADENINPSRIGLGPQHELEGNSITLRRFSNMRYLSVEISFEGQHPIADWMLDFKEGRKIFNLRFFEEGQTFLTGESVRKEWNKTILNEPTLVRLPINDSGSVALVFRARHSGVVQGKKESQIEWKITSQPEVIRVHRDLR